MGSIPAGIPVVCLFDAEDGEDVLAKARQAVETVQAGMAQYRAED